MKQPDATRRGSAGAGDSGVGTDGADDADGTVRDDVRETIGRRAPGPPSSEGLPDDAEDPLTDAETETDTVGAVAPSVVAVVVAHDPGAWFPETLTSLAAQDYPNLSILVIDNASVVDPTPQIADIVPRAFVRRVDGNPGFGAAANLAASMVRGSQFFVFCHDDVALAPNAIRLLVEEAFRSNAGIVGPKLVRWDRPEALLAVGMGADRFGGPTPLCERGELDQEQHDAVRDVFFAPSACFLVRSDLFAALDGFDEAITYHGDDTDLCWRAHLAGARVMVAPGARVRHLEALGGRRADDRRRLQMRHRLRMVFTNYGWFYVTGEVLQQLVLSLVEIVLSVVRGRFGQARDVIGAYSWNLRRLRSLLTKRKQVRATRQVTDLEVRHLHARGSARVTAFLRGQLGAGPVGGLESVGSATLADAGREWASTVRRGIRIENLLAALGVALVLLIGSRDLITGRVPAVGELVVLPDRVGDLLRMWWSGWRENGLGSAGFAPTGLLLAGLVGRVFLGFTGLARTVLVLSAFPLGCWGAWRVGSLTGHGRSKAAALVAYAVNPLPYGALATGSLRGLAAYAMAPWVLHRVAMIGRFAPAEESSTGPAVSASGERNRDAAGAYAGVAGHANRGRRGGVIRQVAALGLTVGVAAAVAPSLIVSALAIALALALGSVLAGATTGALRGVLGAIAGCAVAALLHAAWLSTLALGDSPDLDLVGRVGGAERQTLWSLLRFDATSSGRSLLTLGLLVAGLLGLAIGRSWRWAWAVRGWTLALVPWAVVAVVQAIDADVTLPPTEVLLAPAAVGIALAIASGVAGFDIDLRAYRFGWRQGASVVATAGLVVATLPWLGQAFDGRWGLPSGGFDRTFGFLAAGRTIPTDADRAAAGAGEVTGPFRVLWLGAPEALPAGGWRLDDDLAYATSMGYPGTEGLWSGRETASTRRIPEALGRARGGETSRLGRELGVMSIRYVAVLDQFAPAPFAAGAAPAPAWVDATLGAQLDLQQVDVNAAVRLYRNTAWRPMVTNVAEDVDAVTDLPPATARAVAPAALDADGVARFVGSLDAGVPLVLAESGDPGWALTEGEGRISAPEEAAFGWAARFGVVEGGASTLRYRTTTTHHLVQAAQIAAWIAVLALALGLRPRRRTPADDAAPAGAVAAEAGGPRSEDVIWVGEDTGAEGAPAVRPAPIVEDQLASHASWAPPVPASADADVADADEDKR